MQLESTHGGYAGKSLVNVIQESLDKGMADYDESEPGSMKNAQLHGYVVGMAKALGIIRGTTVKTEIDLSKDRVAEQAKTPHALVESTEL